MQIPTKGAGHGCVVSTSAVMYTRSDRSRNTDVTILFKLAPGKLRTGPHGLIPVWRQPQFLKYSTENWIDIISHPALFKSPPRCRLPPTYSKALTRM